jgi:hypothetical protein
LVDEDSYYGLYSSAGQTLKVDEWMDLLGPLSEQAHALTFHGPAIQYF